MINKEVTSVEEAIQGVDDNMTFMVGGLDYVEFLKIV